MITLNEAYEALQGHEEFVVHQYDGLVSFDYMLCFPGSFDATPGDITSHARRLEESGLASKVESLSMAEQECLQFAARRRNFRGITFDAGTGELVSLPLHKFFNLNQTEETQFHRLQACRATIYEKLDGSMIHFFRHPRTGQLRAATCRSAETVQAQQALELAREQQLLWEMISETIEAGWTPIFEFVAAHNQIVVQYSSPRLVYLISRNRKTGVYRFEEKFPDKADRYEFVFQEILSYLDRREFEGYVCHLDNGLLVKAKTPWYLERHRALASLMRPAYKLYRVVFDGIMDDLLAVAPDRYKPDLLKIYEEAQRDLLREKKRLSALFGEVSACFGGENELVCRSEERSLRKEFVEQAKRYPEDFPMLMKMFVGDDPSGKIQERLMQRYRTEYPHTLFEDLVDDA